jgi:thymidylate synthase (FAD)
MGRITILPETTKDPISLMGRRAGVCLGGNIADPEKNYKRGLDCIKSNHGRVLEFVNVEMVLDGYSARVIREWYTHIGCAPTRLQASTRYIDYNDFDYVIPDTIRRGSEEWDEFIETIAQIKVGLVKLNALNVPREDLATLLPMAMTTTVVDKRNLRNLIDMSRQRMCNRAYWEFRQLFKDICTALSAYSDEWKYIIDTQMMPKCEYLGYCPEAKSCGRMKSATSTNKSFIVQTAEAAKEADETIRQVMQFATDAEPASLFKSHDLLDDITRGWHE